MSYAHRVSYEMFVDSDIVGEIDHLCKIKECINPSHLEDVDSATNLLRAKGHTIIDGVRYCKRGHAFTGRDVIKRKNGYIECRECCNENQRLRRYNRKKASGC